METHPDNSDWPTTGFLKMPDKGKKSQHKKNPSNVTLDDFQALQQTVINLQQRIDDLEFECAPCIEKTDTQSSNKIPLKFAEPVKFGRSQDNLERFLTSVRINLIASDIQSEKMKILYAASFLKDEAQDWFHPIWHEQATPKNERKINITMETFKDFEREIRKAFDHSDSEDIAGRNLEELSQTNTLTQYIIAFRLLAIRVGWSESALCENFIRGLHLDIKRDLVHISPQPETLEAVTNEALRIERTIRKMNANERQRLHITVPIDGVAANRNNRDGY